MAGSWRFTQHPRFSVIICVSAVLILLLFSQAVIYRQQEERHRRESADSTEIPAEHIDPAAIDLTPLVNTLINSSHSGSRQLFSLLSVTSYSSLALHKLTLLVYNISSMRSIESSTFRRRFCYCVTNDTNDLTDFTAILLDVMGNSTSYLHELFKSSSILSVSQKNNSDCIYICVMAGKMGREVPELWDVSSITPLFNQTIIEGPHRALNISSFRLPVEWHQLPTNLSHMSPSGMSSVLTSRVHSTAHASPTAVDETAKVTAAQPLTTTRQPTTFTPKSYTTAKIMETTQRSTAPSRTTKAGTTQRATTPTVAASQNSPTEETTTLTPFTTLKKQTSTTLSAPPAAAPPAAAPPAAAPPAAAPPAAALPAAAPAAAALPSAAPPAAAPPAAAPPAAAPPAAAPPAAAPAAAALPSAAPPAAAPAAAALPSAAPPSAAPPTAAPPAAASPAAAPAAAALPSAAPPSAAPPAAAPPAAASPAAAPAAAALPSAAPPSAAPTAAATGLTTVPGRATAFSPAISLTQTPPSITTAAHHMTSTVHPTRLSPARASAPTVAKRTSGFLIRRTTTPSKATEKPGCPWRRSELTAEPVSGSTTTVGAHKLQPCVLELCKFFSQCLCRPFSYKTRMKRYCDDSHLWYEKHTSEVCRRVRRVSFSKNLKQRCLTKMCNKL